MKINNKKLKYSLNSWVVVCLIAAILIAGNFVFSRYFIRWDLTEDKQYVVSDATKKMLKELDDLITIKVYFSSKLPPQFLAITQQIKDILDEYRLNSKGKVTIKYIDPADDPKIAEEAKSLGVQEVQLNFYEKDKFQVQKGYLGIVVLYSDKYETIPVVQDVSSIEYDLTSAIKKVTSSKVKKVGFLTGHKEHGFNTFFLEKQEGNRDDYVQLHDTLKKTYEITTIDLTDGKPISDIDTLIIAGPLEKYSEHDLFEIDQFIMNGGKVVFLVDRVNMLGNLMAVPLDVGLNDLLKNYGVEVGDNLVLDKVNDVAAFSAQGMQYIIPYPYFVKLIKSNFDVTSPIVSKLEAFVLPWASSVESVDREGVTAQILAKTSKDAWTTKGPYKLDPSEPMMPQDVGQKAMAILVKGKFTSYFKNKQIPEIETKEGEDKKPTFPTIADRKIKESTNNESELIVIGDSDFLGDDQITRWPTNLSFFLNAVDYLTLDPDLINIRSKTITERPIKELTNSLKILTKIIGIALPSIIFALYGFIRIWSRKKAIA